jgi:hypothetical protein
VEADITQHSPQGKLLSMVRVTMVAMVEVFLVVVVVAKHQPVAMGHLPLAVMAVLVSLFHGQDRPLHTQAAVAVAVV